MQHITFKAWLDRKYRKKNETQSSAIARLSVETGISIPCLFYAYHGARVGAEVGVKLENLTRGAVTLSSLVTGPKRSELRIRETRRAAAGRVANG